MRLILHIGTPKTGTSHLQASLESNQKTLLENGILYPKAGRNFDTRKVPHHVGLRFACKPMEIKTSPLMRRFGLRSDDARRAFTRKLWQDLSLEIKNATDAGASTVIMSDEALFSFSDERMIDTLVQNIRPMFSEITIVAFIRRPSNVMQGAYSQRIKMESTLTWSEFMVNQLKTSLYLTKLKLWQSHLSPNEMIVRPTQNDIIERFFETIGINAHIQPAPTGANRSLSPMGISVLRAINEKAAQHNVKRPASIRRAFENNATGQKWVPSTTDRSAVDRHYKSEIEEVTSIFGMGPADCRIIHDWFSESDHPTKPLSAKEILETGVGEMADAILEISNSNRREVLKPIA